jgi:hypothetical protein
MTMKNLRPAKACQILLLMAAACIVPSICAAQAASAGTSVPSPSRFDIYGGYSYFGPVNSDTYNVDYTSLPAGMVTSFTGYFNRRFGLQGEYSKFFNDPDYCFGAVQGGPVFRFPLGRLVPFAHILGGAAQVGPSYEHGGSTNACSWGWTATGGFGVDYILPAFHNRLAIRPVEGDFEYADVDFGKQLATNPYSGGVAQITAYRLSAGFVIRLGETTPALPASYGCEAQPVSVYPGDPVTVTGTTMNLEQGKKLLPIYTWSASGGRIPEKTPTANATIATDGMGAGDYTVSGHVSEGAAPTQHAECSASFRVVAYEPPTIACSISPTSIPPGGMATITAVGRSPQNRRLNYSYGASAGQITGTGATATLTAADVGAGTVNVTCNVVDDLGKSASATTSIAVVAPPAPPPPPAPTALKLCSIAFERDRKRPVRVDNEAKGCLDDIALELNRNTGAVLVVVGKHDPTEKPDAAAERTLNEKQYLVVEKGIEPSRIELRTGETAGRTVDNVLVPPGATWDPSGTESFDPAQVQRHGQPYAPAAPQK